MLGLNSVRRALTKLCTMPRYPAYILCTSPRSGSTLLCKLLAATRQAGAPESYFHNPSLDEWAAGVGVALDKMASKQTMLQSIFSKVQDVGRANTDIFGLRLQRGSFSFLVQQLEELNPGLPNDLARFRAAFGQTLFIHLTRLDTLEQAISLTKAMQTGLWHKAPDGSELERLSAPQDPAYDPALIAQNLAELTALDEAWCDWFCREGVVPLRLTYEELSQDPQSALATVLEALGLERNPGQPVQPGVAKLADEESRAWKRRFLADQAW